MKLPLTRAELIESLSQEDLSPEIVARLGAQAKPAVVLVTSACDEDSLPLGASKIGGRPDMPHGTPWPRRPPYPDAVARAGQHRKDAARILADSRKPRSWMKPEQGERFSRDYLAKANAVESEFPLAFFAQIDLAELAREQGFDSDFPKQGRLLVFYDFYEQAEEFTPEASVGWRLIYDDTPAANLERLDYPQELVAISDDSWSSLFSAARIKPRSVFTAIPPNDKSWDAFPLDDDEALEVYQEWLGDFVMPDSGEPGSHQFGGFPRTLQNGLQARAQLASNGLNCGGSDVWQTPQAKELLKSASDWKLVLQIGVDANAGIPQPGAYYVTMRKQDIAAHRFDRAWLTYQCD